MAGKKSTAITTTKGNALGHKLSEVLTKEQKELIKRNFAKYATDDELAIYFNFCEKAGVDPLRGQAHFIKYKENDKPIMMIGIDGFQARAVEDKRYEGMVANAVYENDEFKMSPVDGTVVHSFGAKDRGKIVGAYAILRRKNMPNAVIWVKFKEYYRRGYQGKKNIWDDKGDVMIVKVAKASLLRREYPDSFSNVYTPEEFGAEITDKGEFIRHDDSPTKQPKVVKSKPEQEQEIQDAEFKDVDEDDKRTEEPMEQSVEQEISEVDEEDAEEEPPKTYKIKGLTKDTSPREALDKILDYSFRHQLLDQVKPVIIKHYEPYADGSRHPYHIPEANIIAIVKELAGVTLKKHEKSKTCKNKSCKNKVTEPEAEEQDGLCFDCWMEANQD